MERKTLFTAILLIFALTSCDKKEKHVVKLHKESNKLMLFNRENLPKAQVIKGWPAQRVQALQIATANALGLNTAFNDVIDDSNSIEIYGPTMVVIPAGVYEMGCNNHDEVCFPRQKNNIIVTHKAPFAVSETEITQADWLLCVKDGYCNKEIPLVTNPQEDASEIPIVGVNWHDAQNYVTWLSEKTRHHYRLLSESEWEYAAKAGSGSAYKLGNTLDCTKRRYKNTSSNSCYYTPNAIHSEINLIKQRKANAFGLYDMHGNAWEWVSDCCSNSLLNTSSDGSAYKLKKLKNTTNAKCRTFIVKGGAYAGILKRLRASHHSMGRESTFFNDQGLRVVRDL